VTLEAIEGALYRYRVVGPDEFDMDPAYISMDSPLGKALLGKRLDDEVVLQLERGAQSYRIMAIDYP
jgi:transcription elongation factor GreB